MTRALVHCHQRKVLHLDVKLVNVLVTKGICKLGDFGYSVSMAQSGTPVGAKAFLVPEYQRQSCCLESLLRLFLMSTGSLGILLWQLDSSEVTCAGKHPQVCELLDMLSANFLRPSCGAW